MKRIWKVEEHEFTMLEMVHNVTRECARRLMNDNDFQEFCKLQDEAIKEHDKTQEEFAKTYYFPGCYGDPRVDC